jgi:serine/threonine protein kinase
LTGIPFGKYQLVKRLARGGMAEVFLARQSGPEGFQRTVAVKRILPHLADSKDFVGMFQDEARLAAQLSHPNIVHIYDFGKVEEHFFIAMEYVDGVHAGVLIKHAESEPMPEVLVARIGADACAGLHYAHELRDSDGRALHLVHRDVSPPNLLVSYDGSVKLVDFGIAKAVSSIEQTRPGVVKGKFAYMSPEQTIGQKLDGRSDVFSLAVLLWELLAGRVMVPRLDPIEGMRMIRDGRIPRIEDDRPEIAPSLAAAIGRGLEVARDDRVTALDLGRAFEEFIKESRDGIGSALELAEWVRARFPRESTSSAYPALHDAPAGTRPATRATHTALPLPGPARPASVSGSSSAVLAVAASERRASLIHDAVAAHASIDPLEGVGVHAALEPFDASAGPVLATTVSALALEPHEDGVVGESFDGVESSSIIVASDWLPDRRHRVADTLSDTVADTLEADTRDHTLPQPFDTETDLHRFLEPTFDSEQEASRRSSRSGRVVKRSTGSIDRLPDTARRRATTHTGGPAGRIALVIAFGAVVGVTSTLVLKKLGGRDDTSGAVSPVPSSSPPLVGAALAPGTAIAQAPPGGALAPGGAAASGGPGVAPTSGVVAPALTGSAMIDVVTAPPGARVSLGAQPSARSPARFNDVPPGSQRLRVTLRGYQTIERTFQLAAGEHRTIELDLVSGKAAGRAERRRDDPPTAAQPPASGVLKVRTRPYSEVYIDGRRLGQTPLITELRPGRYTLVFKHPGLPSKRRSITVRAGDETKLDFAFDEADTAD